MIEKIFGTDYTGYAAQMPFHSALGGMKNSNALWAGKPCCDPGMSTWFADN